jgi:hypothetical protein
LGGWVELGLDPALFWTLTPRVMRCILDAAGRRRVQHLNDLSTQTWNSAALPRQKRLPPLKSMLISPRARRAQPWREQMTIFRGIAASYGGVQ